MKPTTSHKSSRSTRKAPAQEASAWQKMATGWAARVVTSKGCTLHSIPEGGWDVEMPDGSWVAVENWQELCDLADKLKAAPVPPTQPSR